MKHRRQVHAEKGERYRLTGVPAVLRECVLRTPSRLEATGEFSSFLSSSASSLAYDAFEDIIDKLLEQDEPGLDDIDWGEPEPVPDEEPGEVPEGWHRHANGGGLVQDTATVANTVYVGPGALVYGNARVTGNAQVLGNARVYGNARVHGTAYVYGNALVFDHAQVYGNAVVYDDAQVTGNAQVHDNAKVYGNAHVSGDVWIYGNAEVDYDVDTGPIGEAEQDDGPSPDDVDYGSDWNFGIVDLGSYTPPDWDGSVGDRRGVDKLAREWNERFPEYNVWVRMNPHDFGSYPSVVMTQDTFQQASEDTETFPQGAEVMAAELADELGLGY